jgi:hypothetical protein
MDIEIKNGVKSAMRKTHDNFNLREKIIDIGRDTCMAIQRHLPRAHNALIRNDIASAWRHLLNAVEVERTQYSKRKRMGKPELNDCVKLCLLLEKAIKQDAILVQQQQQRTKQSGTQIKVKVTYHSPVKRKPRPHS